MNLEELIAREQIREAIARYAHFADTGRFAELAELFVADGVLEIDPSPPLRGRDAIREFLEGTKSSLASETARPFIRHYVSSVRIELEGSDVASSASYFFVITERGPDHWGRYRDHFTRVEGQWLFRHRRARVDGHAPGSWREMHHGR